jgi:hypothetical protein
MTGGSGGKCGEASDWNENRAGSQCSRWLRERFFEETSITGRTGSRVLTKKESDKTRRAVRKSKSKHVLWWIRGIERRDEYTKKECN